MHEGTGTTGANAAQRGARWLRHHVGWSDELGRIFLLVFVFVGSFGLTADAALLQTDLDECKEEAVFSTFEGSSATKSLSPCGGKPKPRPPAPTIDPIDPFLFQSDITATGGKSTSIVEVEVSLPGATLSPVTYPSDTEWSVLVQGLMTGDHTLQVRGKDSGGRWSNWRAVSFSVDADSYPWVLSQQVPNDIVPSPYPGREGLLVSYDIPPSDPVYSILNNRSFAYLVL